MNNLTVSLREERGFSLIELLVTLVVSMVILAGLLLSFTSQYEEYNYQNKRMDAVQDLEFVVNFIADDIRSSITAGGASVVITDSGAPLNTTDLSMDVWESDDACASPSSTEEFEFWGAGNCTARANRAAGVGYRAGRHYELVDLPLGSTNTAMFASKALKYDRNTRDGNDLPKEILRDVTAFRIFRDTPPTIAGGWTTCAAPGPCDCVKPVGFATAPCGLPIKKIGTSGGNNVNLRAYTILLEMAVDAGYHGGSFIDAAGNSVVGTADPRKRVWRYVQVYPGTTD